MSWLLIRRILGHSMTPLLKTDQVVIAIKKRFQVGDVVIAWVGGKEVIKRVTLIDEDKDRIVLHGDNESDSTDSRQFGPLPSELVAGVVVWPRHLSTQSNQR